MQIIFVYVLCSVSTTSSALQFTTLRSHDEQTIPVEGFQFARVSENARNLHTLEIMLTETRDGTGYTPLKNPRDFAVTHVGCGASCADMIASVRSLALQYEANGQWDAWCVVDGACDKQLNHFSFGSNMTCNKVRVEELVSKGAAANLFRPCASARLWLPQVLTNYKYLFYADSDTVITGSIKPALQMMEQQKATLYMTEENFSPNCGHGCRGWYMRPEHSGNRAGATGYNSGVLGINNHFWNQQGIITKILGILQEGKHGKVRLELGDQDVLNLLVRRGSSLLQQLPCEFNMRWNSLCRDESGYYTPVILHGNSHRFQTAWRRSYNKLVKKTNAMLFEWSNEQRLAVSLWEASKVDVSSLWRDPVIW